MTFHDPRNYRNQLRFNWISICVLTLFTLEFCVTAIFPESQYECSGCSCTKITHHEIKMDCQKRHLTALPPNLTSAIVHLDLGVNSLSDIPDRAFSNLRQLSRLYLVNNSLTSLPANVFAGLHSLKRLSLEGNQLTSVPRKAIRNLHSLNELNLEYNLISSVPNNSFKPLKHLTSIRLDGNRLTEVPVAALKHARQLTVLNLDNNLISEIPDHAFSNLYNLHFLTLSDNQIQHVGKHAFDGLQVLYWLTLDNNLLKQIPEALNSLPDLFDLSIKRNRIEYLEEDCFVGNKKLTNVDLNDNPILTFHKNAFRNMPSLEKLVLSEARDLVTFPNLSGTTGLDKINLDRAAIKSLPDDLFVNLVRLTEFDIHTNKISRIPNMTACHNLTLINFGNNKIDSLDNKPFTGLEKLKDLTLAYNRLTTIPRDAFDDLTSLEYLDLSYNVITYIHPDAFSSLVKLRDLNVGENEFSDLPTKGLQNLRNLKTFHNKYLLQPPNQDDIPKIQTMVLAYAYHCCAFIRRLESKPKEAFSFRQTITWLQNMNASEMWSSTIFDNETLYDDDEDYPAYYDFGINNNSWNTSVPHYYPVDPVVRTQPPVECTPVPGPFLPCDDLFGWWSLRCGVWIVFLLAVLGNGAVLLVSITSKSKMDVTRFLICNLALSDLFMGIYLGFLAIVDASSLGEFEMYAVRWQSSAGCLIAGFLGVLSSELSVYTLVIITIERFYAISHAVQLDKRLRLRQAGILMAVGWFVCLSIACLPLFEVSDYRKFAICLPFETENGASLAYVCFIMIFNAVSFLIIVICYTAMFISIRGSHSWNSNDTIVAKRMALLVFTDFFCWAPIIFCSLTAAFGVNFAQISVNEAKILTIFVLPLNSCANPFLYAFFTRQFKRDCVKLCQRIEEASISRHLQGSGGVRASFAPNRYHSQGSTYRFKNASCGHSNQEASTSGEASYSNSDTELNVKKLPDTEEHILKYVRSDSGIFVDGTKSVPFSEDVQIIDLVSDKPEKKHSSPSVKKIKLRKDIRQDFDSGPDIVLHTKEGHILFKAKKKSLKVEKKSDNERSEDPSSKCAKRLCYHSKMCNSENTTNQNNNVEQVEALVEPKVIEDGEMIECDTSTKQGRKVLLKQKFESERSEDLGLKVKPFKTKKTHPYKVKGTGNKAISIPTKTGLKLRKVSRPELPSEMNEKDKQINEWRKSSHLSYLCKGSGNYNSVAQKQKSNSLVELTRLAYDWKIMSNKRHSLSSRHEGYLLLKNRTRDSVYDDEDLYEFHKPMYAPHAGLGSLGNLYTVIQGCKTEPCSYHDFSIDGDDVCETAILLPVSEKSSKDSRKVNSCESGISSSS